MKSRPKPTFFRLTGGLILVLTLLFFTKAYFFRPSSDYPGSHFNRGANAAWLGVEWVKDAHDEAEVAALGMELRRLKIAYVFAYVSYLKPDGDFNSTYPHATEFVRMLKAVEPRLNVQAWIGVPLKHYGYGYVDLRADTTRRKIAQFSADIIRVGGFDGIHLDPEPVPNGNIEVLLLLEDVRNAIGPDVTLSMATRRIQPVFSDVSLPRTARFAWTSSYYKEVAKRVDQVALMTYDSALPLAGLYRLWTRFQVIALSRALDDLDIDLFIGVPTSEEWTLTHLPGAENMRSGLKGVVDGLNDKAARPSAVAGVAIYPHWETDAAEWLAYEKLWLGRE